jgi:hypothetical protein
MDKAIAKVNQNKFNRYENLFNKAYVPSQNILPFTNYTYTCIIGLHLGSVHLCRGTFVNFIKTISEVLRIIQYFNYVQGAVMAVMVW